MSITIPAREVRKGDIIDFGGQPWIVTDTIPSSRDGKVLLSGYVDEGYVDETRLLADALLNVQRPDPDAELVERIGDAVIGLRRILAIIRETHDITPRADA